MLQHPSAADICRDPADAGDAHGQDALGLDRIPTAHDGIDIVDRGDHVQAGIEKLDDLHGDQPGRIRDEQHGGKFKEAADGADPKHGLRGKLFHDGHAQRDGRDLRAGHHRKDRAHLGLTAAVVLHEKDHIGADQHLHEVDQHDAYQKSIVPLVFTEELGQAAGCVLSGHGPSTSKSSTLGRPLLLRFLHEDDQGHHEDLDAGKDGQQRIRAKSRADAAHHQARQGIPQGADAAGDAEIDIMPRRIVLQADRDQKR